MIARRSWTLSRSTHDLSALRTAAFVCRQCRSVQISAAPSSDSSNSTGDAFGASLDSPRDTADARFEVLGSAYSMLSVTLSASQKFYTRRGTLIAVAGKPDNAQSTLSLLNPLPRAAFGVPFVYQRISSTTPFTALVSARCPTTTFSVLHLDGTTDWIVSQRNAILAWTGHTLALSSQIQRRLALAYWGNTHITGRGLVALSAPGQVYKLTLGQDEEFVAHPGSIVAYTVSRHAPLPFRFKSTSLRLQVPSLTSWIPDFEFAKRMRDTKLYNFLAQALFNLKAVTRRTIWGDRLFLEFRGPATILMSSRGVRITDALTREQINEIADAPAGASLAAIELANESLKVVKDKRVEPQVLDGNASSVHVAAVNTDGKVTFEDSKELKESLR